MVEPMQSRLHRAAPSSIHAVEHAARIRLSVAPPMTQELKELPAIFPSALVFRVRIFHQFRYRDARRIVRILPAARI
jgi:hypothetical protein